MKTKSNMTVSKLQSEAVLEFDKKFFFNRGKLKGFMKPSIDGSNIKQFLSDQIQKAYEAGVNDLHHKIDCNTLMSEMYGWRNILDLSRDELLSIQSKGKIK